MNILVECESFDIISHLEGEATDAEDQDENIGHEGGEVCRLALLCTLRNNQFLHHDDDDTDNDYHNVDAV